jgi:hypothetical protein
MRAETATVVSVRDGFTGVATRIRYGISGGSVSRVRVRVGKDLTVLSVACPDLAGWEFAARLEPALETSGDFYDLIALQNNHWGLVIADVSDKHGSGALHGAQQHAHPHLCGYPTSCTLDQYGQRAYPV